MTGRGHLTDAIRARSKELLGYEIDQVEYRLMPYIQYVMMNDRRVDAKKVNREDNAILKKWCDAGHIEAGPWNITMSRQFWDIICELLFMGYVAYDAPEMAQEAQA
ncbi:MAG: hypothetical protein ACK5XS_10050 [Armatimonadota bacterium]|jgi:hypothetical protein|nr:hypothetical protein [Fimbriimonadaceae bacterium]MCZ8139213.1 hypothetical protein [Fimbriimonadaceae bacterium]